jgi:hypothetical protein
MIRHPAFQHVKWSPDTAELRRFALSMVIGFGVLGGIAVLRHRGIVPLATGLWIAGLVLAVAALVPGLGRCVYLGVYVVSGAIGFLVSNVLLTLVYYLLFTPIGLVLRLVGKDPLRLRARAANSHWQPHGTREDERAYYRRY